MDDDYSTDEGYESNTDAASVADTASLAVVKNEMKMMNVVRTFVFALMITFSTITAEVIYVVVRFNEETVFEDKFNAYANQLIEGFYEKLHTRLVAADSFSTSLTVQTMDKRSVWPYVSFPEFEMRCAGTRQLAEASSVTYSPRVASQNERQYWETYAIYAEHQGTLLSNHTDDFRVSDTDEDTIYYMQTDRTVIEGVYFVQGDEAFDLPPSNDTVFPLWQRSPQPPNGTDVRMYDQMSNPVRAQALNILLHSKQPISGVLTDFLLYDSNLTDYAYYTTPRTALYTPVYDSANEESVVATVDLEFMWETFFTGVLEDDVESVVVVVESSCSDHEYSFQVQGSKNVSYLGEGNLGPDPIEISVPFPVNSTYEAFLQVLLPSVENNASKTLASPSSSSNHSTPQLPCQYRLAIYATEDMRAVFMTTNPEIARWIVLGIFLFVVGVFLVYDCVVDQRSNKVVESAKRTDALVSTLFPSSVKERLLENQERQRQQQLEKKRVSNWRLNHRGSVMHASATDSSEMRTSLHMVHTPKRRIKSFLDPEEAELVASGAIDETEPIADLFPNASVMFADVAGFTAWSSEREPSQVFKLLETLYRSMDKAARRFGVFKVETIGDCYVAATGLPDQRDDHVEALARFARTSLLRTNQLTNALEATLGPGTSELALRFGIHSGPVTAGVLRGEKARFQLFGDTMNLAARMESTGTKNKIHVSQATASILMKRGKAHWVEKREEKVNAKGKGELTTYWLLIGTACPSTTAPSSCSGGSVCSSEFMAATKDIVPSNGVQVSQGSTESVLMGVIGENKLNRSLDRLVEWNTGALATLLEKVVISRGGSSLPILDDQSTRKITPGTSRSFMDEMDLFVPLPGFDAEVVARVHETTDFKLPRQVRNELRMYITAIASGYRRNAFHNFEHASHVILSATKLLKRISYADGHSNEDGVTTEDLHHFTYGISSDPLTQFAVVFAALIHDVGHEGVPNGQLAKELPHIATLYDNKSIAEQRSVDVALELLMLPKYKALRDCICGSEAGQTRFRKLLIHCVLATDIFEKDLKAKRNQRWEQAFHNAPVEKPASNDDMHCKATIVLEHVIQASDVSHTMQHWHVYIKWNQRLYQEMYTAYKTGRSDKDPSEGWYKGELWFYDNYVIPLAKKLKECGVFGVSSDEYLTYAQNNRDEWEQRGQEICKSFQARCERIDAKREAAALQKRDENVYRELYHDELEVGWSADDDDDNHSQHSYKQH